MLHIVLHEPEIPQNTGNIARTCAATGAMLHLIEPLGFELSDRYLKRAGLDYWPLMKYEVLPNWNAFLECYPSAVCHFATTRGHVGYADVRYGTDDFLVFGKETKGLPDDILSANPQSLIRIPMRAEARSLNLSNSVAIVLYEALRQHGFANLVSDRRQIPQDPQGDWRDYV